MEDRGQIKHLLQQYMLDQASPEETDRLLRIIAEKKDAVLWEELVQEITAGQDDLPDADPVIWQPFVQSVVKQAKQEEELIIPARRVPLFRTWWAAASIILLLGLGAYYWSTHSGNSAPSFVAKEIQPGKEGAILTLADGSQVSLDTITNGVVALQGGTTARVVNGSLHYEGASGEMLYNTIATPKGRQYHVKLPDGTLVWLNAASTIRYPVVFNGSERRVEITGEAYFEVAKNKEKPFLLNVNKRAEVAVLGTHFNVNAYENEESIATTLMEGAVRMTANNNHTTAVLKPGQQAQLRNDAIKLIDSANTEKVLAWKNGLFYFEGASLQEIMRQIERWYDIDVVYEKDIQSSEFSGKMTRGITLHQLLEGLEVFGVHYRLEGRKLIIMP